jgi:quinoprotein glucose dehydrogenase
MTCPLAVSFRNFAGIVAAVFASFAVEISFAQNDAQNKTNPIPISADTLPVKIERAFPELQIPRPIYITYPPDGTNRLAVISQYGSVMMFSNDPKVDEAKEFLNIEKKVVYKDRENEEGMLGLAFHPKYKQNGEFFVYYSTTDSPHTSVLSRFKVTSSDPNKADPATEEELFRTPTKPNWNHNGGTIIFGPDGYLYIAIGDGGAANDPWGHGQSLETVMGKILRIDVDHHDPGMKYAVPKDNPFVGVDKARPEIWALGLRNVWRMAFDRQTHKLWAGDVGQDTWEEIDIITKGGNYGWNIREGLHKFTRHGPPPPAPAPEHVIGELIDPIFDYHHDIGKSITGGGVYRGKQVPELVGKYVFADYVKGQVYALSYDESTGKATAVQPISGGVSPVFTFGEDEQGEIYMGRLNNTLERFRSGSN